MRSKLYADLTGDSQEAALPSVIGALSEPAAGLVNVAVGAAVIGSSTTWHAGRWGFGPETAIDGDENSYWLTDAGVDGYVEIDLGAAYRVSHVGYRTGKADHTRVSSFTLKFSDDSTAVCEVNTADPDAFQWYDVGDVETASLRWEVLNLAGSGWNVGTHEIAVLAAPENASHYVPPVPPEDPCAPIEDKPGLPRVLLIGDSISIGYTLATRELLNGKANVHRIPENGLETRHGLKSLERWLGGGRWDVIHFNWGLHEVKRLDKVNVEVPIEEYDKNLRQLVARLKKRGAALIWASSTPVPEGGVSPIRFNKDAVAYNAVARKIMDENAVPINDLYAFTLPNMKKLQQPTDVHFTEEGSSALAAQVAASIEQALKSRN